MPEALAKLARSPCSVSAFRTSVAPPAPWRSSPI